MKNQDNLFKVLVAVAALAIASAAAYFSIFGISKLFAGYAVAVIIMATALEYGKLIAVSYLHRYWKEINTLLKVYLLVGIMSLMIITSAGIYGFLSNAYQQTAHELTKTEQVVSVLETKKNTYVVQIEQLSQRAKSKSERINMLSNLRSSQEVRLDSLYMRGNWVSQKAAKSVEANIAQSNDDIKKLDVEVAELNDKIGTLQDSIIVLDNKKIDTQNNKASSDLGPLQYLARLTGKPMDIVINWFIMLLIFVFDPFAVSLVIAMNHLTARNKTLVPEPEPIVQEEDDEPFDAEKAMQEMVGKFNHEKEPLVDGNGVINLPTDLIDIEQNVDLIEPSYDDTHHEEEMVDEPIIPSPDDTSCDEDEEPSVSERLKRWSDGNPIEDNTHVDIQNVEEDVKQDKPQQHDYQKGMRPDGGISS